MLTTVDVQGSIQNFLLEQFPAARKRGFGANDSLLTSGIIDSLGILEIVGFLEKQFEITLSDDEMVADHFESLESLTRLVLEKSGGNGP